jgi:flagellar hook assembly protein FlgD
MAPLSSVPVATAPQLSTPPGAFSPDGDGHSDVAQWSATVDADTRVLGLRILRGNTVVWGYTEITEGAGTFMLSWDGRDAGGRIVPPGFYRYELRAMNRAHAASPITSGVVEVQSGVHWTAVPRRY